MEEEVTKPKEEAKPKPKEEAKPKPKEEAKPKPKEEVKPKPKEEVKPKPKEEVKPKPKEEAKPKPKEEAKPKIKAEITDISGIGSKTAMILKENGFDTVTKIAETSIDLLSQVPGIGKATADKIIKNAKSLLEGEVSK
ncbi:MAG: helix-hairpin-helix domain-containing protein [Candidatus Heimdallarchaeaceae archaeon]